MIQGGDPTGTGKGGTSIWGKKFNDEIRESLKVFYYILSEAS
jgi:peptidyl-prolyl cis-trans isomerase-like 3